VARASGGAAHQVEQGVLLAVDPQDRDAFPQRGRQGFLVRVPDEQDIAAVSVLQGDRHDPGARCRDRGKLAEVQGKPGSFLTFTHPPILHNSCAERSRITAAAGLPFARFAS
jgi:hypothetical protein